MKTKVLNWIDRNEMIEHGDNVVCAVSGGVDSMVLLHIMNSLKDELGIKVFAAHFNHHIRGEESDRDEEFVRRYCESNYIPFYSGDGDVIGRVVETGESTEEAARYLRYKFLNTVIPGAKIATAHHANDNLETMLMKLIRGCGPTGICGIPPMRDNIIRPLLCITREEIIEYATENSIGHVEDSTNACDDYLRNRIRHNIIPLIVAENAKVLANCVETAQMLRDDDTYLNEMAIEEINKQNNEYTIDWINSLASPIKTRVIKKMLEKNDVAYNTKMLEIIQNGLVHHSRKYSINLPNSRVLVVNKDKFYIENEETKVETKGYLIKLDKDTEYKFRGYPNIEFKVYSDVCEDICKDPMKLMINRDKISGKLYIRNRQAGDVIELPNCTKTIGKAMRNKNLLPIDKDMYPVICDDTGVIAVPGIGVDVKYRVKEGDSIKVLEFKQ